MAGAWGLVPVAIVALIDAVGWRGTYLVFAAILVGGFLPLVALFLRQSPREIGQVPDGLRFHAAKKHKSFSYGNEFTPERNNAAPRLLDSFDLHSGLVAGGNGPSLSSRRRVSCSWFHRTGLHYGGKFGRIGHGSYPDRRRSLGRSPGDARGCW